MTPDPRTIEWVASKQESKMTEGITPGNWTYVDGLIVSDALPENEYVAAGEWEGQMAPFMNDSDGVLCAASKDMLEALEELVTPRCQGESWDKARAAIAKARGIK